jgi:hypothetical protein
MEMEAAMIEIPYNEDFSDNVDRYHSWRDGYMPCIICGKPVDMSKNPTMVNVVQGSELATEEEAEAIMTTGHGDCGGYPIGANCLKKRPELKPYALKSPKSKRSK